VIVIVAVGAAITVTVTAELVAVQPLLFVTVTLYEPAADTTIDCVVAPVLHSHETPALAVSVTLLLEQIVVDPLGVIVAVNTGC
jgi:hypothetical protein